MSDDIHSIETPFPDVASLAQGYMNRADGERLLLPLAEHCAQGAGVRFVVYLSEGTPAFAGAGLCVQVSDQGATVPPKERFETLLDTLQFDERSRPVYDYIVAVRSAAYAQQAPTSEAQSSAEPDSYEEPTSILKTPPPEPTSVQPDSWSQPPVETLESMQPLPDSIPTPAFDAAALREPSFVPPPIPTGLLTRPARATHWQPAPPRRPTPRPSSGLFRYPAGALPRPARPPRPVLDSAYVVQPAPKP